ncbi:hypothetical protein EDB80DRAFT_746294 [Ilyonectria destructans]|nr:hypothetical protein EDB80DRAFT_746294 [Ilyonectria destructans]
MATAASPTVSLPSRATTGLSAFSDEAVPEVDPTTTAGLLAERLQAWKHCVGYLEDYVGAMEKIHGRHAKEYEKVLKTISNPLKEGHHFDQSLGGVAGFFENLRSNTQAMINTNIETEKSIKGSVLPILERLHKEIKHKAKELAHGVQKGAKEVEKARNTTQKHIELLGQQSAAYDSAGGNFQGHDDPYVVRRGILHRLSNQVIAENNHHNDLLAVQTNFSAFEAHVIEVIQQAMEAFTLLAGGQGEKMRALHTDVLGAVQRVTPDFEWNHFQARSADRLVSPDDPARSVEAVVFPNMDHSATKAMIEGSLERKSRNKLSWGYSTGYYVVTPSKFLHEFKDSDNTRQDPKPEMSVYLPDATIGTPSGDKFSVKGKDRAKTMSSKLTGSSELSFKAHTAADAQKWFQIISNLATATGQVSSAASTPVGSTPTSPVLNNPASFGSSSDKIDDKLKTTVPVTPAGDHKAQEAGVMGAELPVSEKKA